MLTLFCDVGVVTVLMHSPLHVLYSRVLVCATAETAAFENSDSEELAIDISAIPSSSTETVDVAGGSGYTQVCPASVFLSQLSRVYNLRGITTLDNC